MGAGPVLLLLALISFLSTQKSNIKEVCDRLPYEQNKPIFPGSDGDGGYRIIIEDIKNGYIPGKNYTVLLIAPEPVLLIAGPIEEIEFQAFTRFTINGRAASNKDDTDNLVIANEERVGSFTSYDDVSILNKDCQNSLSEVNKTLKREVKINWKAPKNGSGCVAISAMVFENSKTWYSDDGLLTQIICESYCRYDSSDDAVEIQ